MAQHAVSGFNGVNINETPRALRRLDLADASVPPGSNPRVEDPPHYAKPVQAITPRVSPSTDTFTSSWTPATEAMTSQAPVRVSRTRRGEAVSAQKAVRQMGQAIQQGAKPGPFETRQEALTFQDATRGNRQIDALLYTPQTSDGKKAPLVVLSHGLGGSEKTLGYLAQHLASQGYAVLALNHPGSDATAVRQEESRAFEQLLRKQGLNEPVIQQLSQEGISRAEFSKALNKLNVPEEEANRLLRQSQTAVSEALLGNNPTNWANRPQDVSFVLDELEKKAQRDPAFAQRIDLENIAAAGHSYGSYTAMALAGAQVNMPNGWQSFRDERIKAAFILSPVGYEDGRAGPFVPESFSTIQTPLFGIAGAEENPAYRSQPVRLGPDQDSSYMWILNERHHESFGNSGDEQTQRMVRGAASVFLGAYLRNDPANQAILAQLAQGDASLWGNPFYKQ